MTKPGLSLPLKTENGKKPGAKWFEDEVSGCSVVAPDRCILSAIYGPQL